MPKAAGSGSDTLILPIEDISQVELEMIRMGLVDIQSIDTTIHTDIKYSTTENFLKSDIYGDYNKAYLQPDVAEKLVNAQTFLKELHPGYRLLVFDAARTVSAQKMLWDSLKMPAREKGKFACNPQNGSLHNFGAAVDLSIIDDKGKELDMGCPYDYFGPLAYPVMENQLISDSTLTQQQVDNRKLLRQVMAKSGFFNIQTEWWHFNSCTRTEAMERYERIE
ncbi:MAG TPA: M15 family metallopeptidase [Bacteroidales bacterium]|nr:M15 family metallopeptidase [Bacteroidales bacterium]